MSKPPDASAVEVFSEKPVMSVLGLIKVGAGGLLLGAVGIALVRGTGQGHSKLLITALAAFLLAVGIYDLRKVADRRPQVRLTARGMTALELGEVLVPWDAMTEIEYVAGAGSTAMVRFHLRKDVDLPFNFNPLVIGGAFQFTTGGARFVQIAASPLQDARGLIFAAAARFAPGLALRGG